MAKNTILRTIIALLSAPHIAASRLLCKFGPEAFKADIEKCSGEVAHFSVRAQHLRCALVIAEDHRNELHFGIDPVAIISALLGRFLKGKSRGASTIEQQFVRVVTNRYERSARRKIREQLIAIEICKRHDKSQIADAYLSRAFFGSGQEGVEQLEKSCAINLEKLDLVQSIALTAQLKYPKPLVLNKDWHERIGNRWIHLRRVRQSNLDKMNKEKSSLLIVTSHDVGEQVELQNRV